VSTSEIAYDPETVSFIVPGQGAIPIARDDAVIAPLEAVSTVTVASLQRALAAYAEDDAATVTSVFLSDVPAAEFNPDTSPRDVALDFLGGALTAQIGRALDADGGPAIDVPALMAPLLNRHGGEHDGQFRDDHEGRLFEGHSVRLVGDDRSIGELFSLAQESQALLDAAAGVGALTARTARDLVAAGRSSVLLGQPEASWIDAKVEPQHVDGDSGVEFAKDVAAFANTGADAIIVWGIRTAKAPGGGDVLDAVRPFELSGVDTEALRSALAARLVPLLTDVEIHVVESRKGSGYGLGWIFIPAQPSHVRPVLVRGAIESSRVLGTHISIPFRVGEDTRHWDASTVHSLIQAGRVALQNIDDKGHDSAPASD
jgi:hypothetical protein